MEFAIRKKMVGNEIIAIRKKLKLTQEELAIFCGVSKKDDSTF